MMELLTLLHNDYVQILKNIAWHESEIAKLKKKAHDIENQLKSIEAIKTEKTQLDKDDCLYWDSVLK